MRQRDPIDQRQKNLPEPLVPMALSRSPKPPKVLGAQDDVLQLAVSFGAAGISPLIVAATTLLKPTTSTSGIPGCVPSERGSSAAPLVESVTSLRLVGDHRAIPPAHYQ